MSIFKEMLDIEDSLQSMLIFQCIYVDVHADPFLFNPLLLLLLLFSYATLLQMSLLFDINI